MYVEIIILNNNKFGGLHSKGIILINLKSGGLHEKHAVAT
jgi:hypothetical protein